MRDAEPVVAPEATFFWMVRFGPVDDEGVGCEGEGKTGDLGDKGGEDEVGGITVDFAKMGEPGLGEVICFFVADVGRGFCERPRESIWSDSRM